MNIAHFFKNSFTNSFKDSFMHSFADHFTGFSCGTSSRMSAGGLSARAASTPRSIALLFIAGLCIAIAGCQDRPVNDDPLLAIDTQGGMVTEEKALEADAEAADAAIPDPEGVAYRTGGEGFAQVWHAFYDLGFHEPELDDPLIEAGPAMVPAICEAIRHKDMKRRRYAISALGFIGDRSALPSLEAILADTTEADYVRGDALASIHLIDHALGVRHARQHQQAERALSDIAKAVLDDAPWLRERSQDDHTGEDYD